VIIVVNFLLIVQIAGTRYPRHALDLKNYTCSSLQSVLVLFDLIPNQMYQDYCIDQLFYQLVWRNPIHHHNFRSRGCHMYKTPIALDILKNTVWTISKMVCQLLDTLRFSLLEKTHIDNQYLSLPQD
jgi:hypothetical protein